MIVWVTVLLGGGAESNLLKLEESIQSKTYPRHNDQGMVGGLEERFVKAPLFLLSKILRKGDMMIAEKARSLLIALTIIHCYLEIVS